MTFAKQFHNMLGNNMQFLIPLIEPISRICIGIRYDSMDAESVFTQIYKKHYWGGNSSSGPGSDLDQTSKLIERIPEILNKVGAKSVLDIPCGDFNWQRYVSFDSIHYVGADIVPQLVEINNKLFSNTNRHFVKLDIRKDPLPNCDLVLCRDLFQHLSYEDIWDAISNIKSSDCKYLLASSQTKTKKNTDIATGGWRKTNLLLPPFSFPKPMEVLNEGCPVKYHSDKSLLLWKIKDL